MTEQPLRKARLYLATPYNGTLEEQQVRFTLACELAGFLIAKGWAVFSPIAHSRPIAEACRLPQSAAFWSELNATWLRWATELVVVRIGGWDKSLGIATEIRVAKSLGKGLWLVEIVKLSHDQLPVEVRFERLTGSSTS